MPIDPCSGRGWQARTYRTRMGWAAAKRPCAICGQPIDYRLRWPHKRSLSVDHIHPRWAGGSLMDPTNWQPAHLGCNSGRGAREGNHQRRVKHISAPW